MSKHAFALSLVARELGFEDIQSNMSAQTKETQVLFSSLSSQRLMSAPCFLWNIFLIFLCFRIGDEIFIYLECVV